VLSTVRSGRASRDDSETIYGDEMRADVGAITAAAVRGVEAGLRAAFGVAG